MQVEQRRFEESEEVSCVDFQEEGIVCVEVGVEIRVVEVEWVNGRVLRQKVLELMGLRGQDFGFYFG